MLTLRKFSSIVLPAKMEDSNLEQLLLSGFNIDAAVEREDQCDDENGHRLSVNNFSRIKFVRTAALASIALATLGGFAYGISNE